ncbi:fatty acid--CoA ligase [Bacillus massiliigorillae]|uniref:fatty acid--CoA ligase n=1 Tax=Bacillus massiliigorillae TaxID=1243664 RepID=UPI00039E38F8|nr:fatty acid--CoA ligase [Bacillus massiliigorillae]
MSMTIGSIFELTVRNYPNKEALYDIRSNNRYTYKEWSEEVTRLANALKGQGVKKGDRVSTFLYNREELATTFFACAKLGAIFNPINFRLMAEEVAYILEDATPKVVLFEQALEDVVAKIEHRFPHISFWYTDDEAPNYAVDYEVKVKQAPTEEIMEDMNENDDYAIMYTSGTTGRPKGVIHRHRDMVEQSMLAIQNTKITFNDRGLIIAPMFHCAELHVAFLPRVHSGASNVIMHQFNPVKTLETIEKERITKFFAAPTMWNMLLQENYEKYDLSSMKLGLYGAAPMAPVLVTACREKLGVQQVQAYGMTEMGPAITFLAEDDQIRKAGSAGKACLNHEIRIVRPNEDGPSEPDDVVPNGQTGEIIVQGPCVMRGYFQREEDSKKALYKGWYHSGDIGYLDDEGYLWVKDRVDDMIISGGENVYPREVEDLLYEYPGVLDVAVIGQPDEHWGEIVTAFIVTKDETMTAEDLEAYCKNSEKLANYKRPRKYIFCETMPRNASGKIQKFILRKQLEDILSSDNAAR